MSLKKIFVVPLYIAVFILISQCSRGPVTQITAHRGASGSAPENTLASLQMAMRAGADYSEIDVQETADGRIILLHDDTVDRTTTGSGPIWQLDFNTLTKLDAGAWFSSRFTGEKIPLLKTVIDSLGDKIRLNIELKINSNEQNLAQRVAKILNDRDFIDHCIVTSFDFEAIKKIRAIDHRIQTGYILGHLPDSMDVFAAPVKILSIHKNLATAEFIKKVHDAGKAVHVWTVNDSTEMQRLISLKADNIITNYPEKLRQILNHQKEK